MVGIGLILEMDSSSSGTGSPKQEHIVIDGEKNISRTDEHALDVAGEGGAHILDAHQLQLRAGEGDVKTTADGKTVLIPQPSSDPNDPLNWSKIKKATILTVISVVAFMPDFGSSMGIVTLLPQAM